MRKFLALDRKGGWTLVYLLAATMITALSYRRGIEEGRSQCNAEMTMLAQKVKSQEAQISASESLIGSLVGKAKDGGKK